jgi:hypothetical protein
LRDKADQPERGQSPRHEQGADKRQLALRPALPVARDNPHGENLENRQQGQQNDQHKDRKNHGNTPFHAPRG